MAIRELSTQEFHNTFREPMRRLEANESYRPIPLKMCVEECIEMLGLPATLDSIEIQHVYLNGDQTYSHILFFFGEANQFLVIVVSHKTDTVHGYHLLDLNREYGAKPEQP
jgi:hypothetical protein